MKESKGSNAQHIIERKYAWKAFKHIIHQHHHPPTSLPFLDECLKRYEISYVNMLHVLINPDVRLYPPIDLLIVNSCSKNTNASSNETVSEK